MTRILVIDNFDSFTFNLVHYLEKLDFEVIVKRNNQITPDEIIQLDISHILISPGPCDPDKAGHSLAIIEHLKTQIPILGVCLGHQAIGQHFGANIVKAKTIMHGKTSSIFHSDTGMFRQLPQGFTATRYHSLVIDKATLPDCLEITAWTENETGDMEYIMGVKHKQLNIEGVQFHPESIMSNHGLKLLANFFDVDNQQI